MSALRSSPIDRYLLPVELWNPERAAPNETKAYIDISSIDQATKAISTTCQITPSTAPSRARQIVREGDVLVSTVRPNLNAVAYVTPDYSSAIASTGFAVLRCDTSKLLPRYLYHFARTKQFVSRMVQLARGASYPAVTDTIVKETEIPDPQLVEQKRIAAILDNADEIRRKRNTAIALIEMEIRSVFLQMFGDPISNSRRLPVTAVGFHTDFVTSGSRGWARYYASRGAKFLRIENVGRNELLTGEVTFVQPPPTAETRRTRVQPGDVLVSITADLGRTAVVPDDLGEAYINQHLAILRTTTIDPVYLSAFLASSGGQVQFARLNREGVKAGLNFDDIRALQILEPPRDEQLRFRTIWCRLVQLKSLMRTGVVAAEQLVQTLTTRAFRGEL